MLQDQSRNRTPMPGAQAPEVTPPDTGPARAEAGIAAMLSETPFVLPAQMPAPGSAEAMALHKAACTEFDRRTHLTDADYARLKIGDTHTLWTLDTVREVMEGDYSSLLGNEAYAASATSRDELQELLVLTTRREHQFEEALRGLKLHEVHALAFPDDQEEPGGVGGEDPIHAAIREHKAVYAAWLPHLRAINETPLSDPGYSALEAAAEAPGKREHEAYTALSEVLPTTHEGLLALASYLPGAVLRNSCTNADSDAMHALGAMCGAVKELVQSGRISSLDEVVDLHSLPAVKTDPIFTALAESRRLYALWQGTYDEWPHGSIEPPAVLARMNAGCGAFMNHLKETVLETTPTSLAGCASLGRYVMELFEREEIDGDEHGRAALNTITEGLRALPVEAAPVINELVDTVTSPVIAAVRNHENAWRRTVEASALYDALGDLPGQSSAKAEEIEAADEASKLASERSDQAWRDLFRSSPQTLHEFWLLFRHIEQHHGAHHGITDAPDIWGTLTGAVAAMRTALKAPKVTPHDLSKLSVVQLSTLYEVCRQQREILLTVEERAICQGPDDRRNPLGRIMEAEGERFGFLGDDVICELERRRPNRESERDLVLEARVRHYMSCGEVFDAKLIADITATWGAK